LNMTSPRQSSANRANAAKSSGPRTKAGKQRASSNGLKHGLASDSRLIYAVEIEQLAHEIEGEATDTRRTECARNIARAMIDLQRARQAKVALIERVIRFGTLKRSFVVGSLEKVIFTPQEMSQIDNALARSRMPRLRRIKPVPMPEQEPVSTTEAVRRALPELVVIDGYETAAMARLNRGVRQMFRSTGNHQGAKFAERTQFSLGKSKANGD
jgi:hypothetical protein